MKKTLFCSTLMFYTGNLTFHQMCLILLTLKDLDTMNPILIIDRKLKLIGEYEETMGTCFFFSEDEAAQMVPDERGPSEANLTLRKSTIHPNQAPRKQVKPVGRLYKTLKFRVLLDDEVLDATTEQLQDLTC
ncbi:hypothetical protein Dsin_004614 [Dipteronia sinensis]|uniref:Transcription factor TFIIIC triple barrel domain-containing protein n=1 Tax=Dipteronia sinensis TaxID=43782 RepID=A0AAE0EEE0_9ROSI|nr:hypothetical protein Dsin_004614 [Dipteronia sinensis]